MLPKFRTKDKITESDIVMMDIKDYMGFVIDPKSVIRTAYRNLNEVFGGNIPERFMNRFKLNPYSDCILENLNTHDSDMLIRKIRETFGFNVDEYSDIREGGKRFMKLFLYSDRMDSTEIDSFIEGEKFRNLVDFFGYSISDHYPIQDGSIVYLEPIYAEDANEKVYGEKEGCSYGRIYHITTKDNVEKILSSGFRVSNPESGRNEDPAYRNYPKRIYFLAIPPMGMNIEERPEIETAVELYFNEKQRKKGYCILQADVRGLNIDFYTDSVSEGDYAEMGMQNDAVYTYCNIPKERVKLVYCSK